MDFIEIAKKRYSVRSYKDKKVEEEKLQKILEVAHVAPTAANLQPVRLIAVQSSEGLAKIGKGANLYGAPLAVIVCADHGKAWERPFDKKQTTDIDASLSSRGSYYILCPEWLSKWKFMGGSQAGNWWLPRRIIFKHPKPGSIAQVLREFCSLTYRSISSRISFDKSILSSSPEYMSDLRRIAWYSP